MPGAAAQRLPLAVLVVMFCGGPLRAEEFFPTRDENPLLRGFYVPLASDSRADAGPTTTATFSIMNTVHAERRGTEQLLVDGESDTLRLSFDNALSSAWRYRISVPLIRDSGGFLDSAIDTWHRIFGFNPGDRPNYPKNQLMYFYSGTSRIYLQQSETGLGDISAETGWYATDSAERTVSFWGGLKAPTGSVARLVSDGAWDAAIWGHVASRWNAWRVAGELGVRQPFGDELFGGAAHLASAFARAAVTRDLGPSWSLRAQLDGQTNRVAGTTLRFLGPSLQLSVGAVHRMARWRLEMGFVEDAAVDTAPDITFFLGIHN